MNVWDAVGSLGSLAGTVIAASALFAAARQALEARRIRAVMASLAERRERRTAGFESPIVRLSGYGFPVTEWLKTERLILRQWCAADRAPFAALNGDPQVMEHFPATLDRAESDEVADRIERGITENGFGFWALELAETGEFLGFTGLSVPRFEAHFTPAVEIGWRLSRASWGRGYASEAATRALAFAFEERDLPEVVSFTATTNTRSQAVMRRIGMTHDPADDFDHPVLPAGHRLERHVLWRVTAAQWRARTA